MVNNFIDLVADDIVILKATPHGKFIDQYQKEIDNIDEAINNSRTLILEKNPTEMCGRVISMVLVCYMGITCLLF